MPTDADHLVTTYTAALCNEAWAGSWEPFEETNVRPLAQHTAAVLVRALDIRMNHLESVFRALFDAEILALTVKGKDAWIRVDDTYESEIDLTPEQYEAIKGMIQS